MAGPATLLKKEISVIAEEYGLPRVSSARACPDTSPGSRYLVETVKGKFVLSLDEMKTELEAKREIDLLLFLRKHGFPCMTPLADRKGRHSRELGGRVLSMARFIDGRHVGADDVHGRSAGESWTRPRRSAPDRQELQEGIDNRFSFERMAEMYRDVRNRLPHYFKKIIRTLDEETDYLSHYLEGKLPKASSTAICRTTTWSSGRQGRCDPELRRACRGKFIFDLATVVNALCFEEGKYVLRRFEALIAGYESLRTLSLAEWMHSPTNSASRRSASP